MRALAAELGYAVVFPTNCRHCDTLIYLYAAPNGGFAIFDSLGGDWPKHSCRGISPSTNRYSTLDAAFRREYSRAPVPQSTRILTTGGPKHLMGTVVESTLLSDRRWQVHVFDGRDVHIAVSETEPRLGTAINATLTTTAQGQLARLGEPLAPPTSVVKERAPKWSQPTNVQGIDLQRLHDLQLYAAAQESIRPGGGKHVADVANALVEANDLVAAWLLIELILLESNEPSAGKLAHVALLADILSHLKLSWLLAGLHASASKGLRQAMDADPTVGAAVKQAKLTARFSQPDDEQRKLRRLIEREADRAAGVRSTSPQLNDFAAQLLAVAKASTAPSSG